MRQSAFVVILVLYREIYRAKFEKIAPEMFSILSANMERVHPGETGSEEDFPLWFSYQRTHFEEKRFIAFEDGEVLAGYFQYSVVGDTLMIEELEIRPDYQVRYAILGGLLRFMGRRVPRGAVRVSAYISKNNPRSYHIAEKLGLSVIGENASGKSFLYSGDLRPILERYGR